MVQVEQRVAGAGHAVHHLPAHAAVAARVRLALDAVPGRVEVVRGQAPVDLGLGGAAAHEVVDAAVDAVVRDLVPRPERVGVVGEGPRRDAPVGAGPVAAEAVDGVEEDRLAEVARVELLIPVSRGESQQRACIAANSAGPGSLTAGSRCSCTRFAARSRGRASSAGGTAEMIPELLVPQCTLNFATLASKLVLTTKCVEYAWSW